MPLPDQYYLNVHEADEPSEPALDTWLHTDGLDRQLGHELAAATRPVARDGDETPLSAHDVRHCLVAWAGQRAAGAGLTEILLHDGLIAVTPVATRRQTVADVERDEQVHLCLLDEHDTIEVVSWTATVDTGVLDDPEPEPIKPIVLLHDVLHTTVTDSASPAHVLLHHLDPEGASADFAARVARVGALGALQLPRHHGASAVLGALRHLAAELDVEAAEIRTLAADTARRWATRLWPADSADFDRRRHLPSVALAHHLEAAALALELYPAVPILTLNQATMTTMWVLADGRWARNHHDSQPVKDLVRDLAHLPEGAWQSLVAGFEQEHEQDSQAAAALASLLGCGARPPSPRDLIVAVPDRLPDAVRANAAAAAADLAVCRSVGVRRTDLLATVLAARSVFDD